MPPSPARRASISIPGRCRASLLDALAARAARTAPISSSSKASWVCSTARPARRRRRGAAPPPISPRISVCRSLLVLDVARQAQSAAALVRGFAAHDPAVRIAGVILNRVGSERHRALVADAIAALGVPVLGALPREAALALPERHLGLVQAGEHADLAALIERLRRRWPNAISISTPLSRAPRRCRSPTLRAEATALPPPGQRIALAQRPRLQLRLSASHQCLARRRRARLCRSRRSPIEAPPDDADSCWLPGGYPELHADALAAARHFSPACGASPRRGRCMASAAATWCSAKASKMRAATRHAMTGLLGHHDELRQAQAASRLPHRAAACRRRARPPRTRSIRGHEFHYASLTHAGDDEPFAELPTAKAARSETGGRRGRVTGTFFHAIAAAEA